MYVDLSAHGVTDSLAMCGALLEEAGVAMTPGVDFEDEGCGLGERRIHLQHSCIPCYTPLDRQTDRETHGLSRGRPKWSSGGQTQNYPSPNRESLNRESLNAIVMSSHHTVPASELKRCSASTAVAPETKETPSATTSSSRVER